MNKEGGKWLHEKWKIVMEKRNRKINVVQVILLTLLFVLTVLFLSACGKSDNEQQNNQPPAPWSRGPSGPPQISKPPYPPPR